MTELRARMTKWCHLIILIPTNWSFNSFFAALVPQKGAHTPDVFKLAGDAAKDVLKDALQNLMIMCQHVRGTMDTAVVNHRAKNAAEEMDVDRN